MLKNTLVILGLGMLWLFVFSIPVSNNRRFFDVAFNVVVDTTPMNWVVGKVQSYFELTRDMPAVESRVRGHESGNRMAQGSSRKN